MIEASAKPTLTSRWTQLRPHPVQAQVWNCDSRFVVIPAGRRSGKTELAKRKVVKTAINAHKLKPQFSRFHYFCAAPTRDQAKRIYWEDLKALVPSWLMVDRPSESDLSIRLINGAEIQVVGMDKPQRIEGTPWDGGVLDEYANMKSGAWGENVRPALSDRAGWCWLIGVPEGRNHYYKTYRKAMGDVRGLWKAFTWKSADILSPEEIESAREDLDPITFQQEYEADFVSFSGRAYYPFNEAEHMKRLRYNPASPLIFCFDFNVSPGIAVVIQEQAMPGVYYTPPGSNIIQPVYGTGVIGEVYIPQNSTTEAVCRRLIADWKHHLAPVLVYGDATGGNKGSAKLAGSDWEIVQNFLRPVFKGNLLMRVDRTNPPERSRVNAVNSRLKSAAGIVRMMVDPQKAPHVVTDFEGVKVLEGGSGELDKKDDPSLTHLTDAIGYYIHKAFPVGGGASTSLTIPGM